MQVGELTENASVGAAEADCIAVGEAQIRGLRSPRIRSFSHEQQKLLHLKGSREKTTIYA